MTVIGTMTEASITETCVVVAGSVDSGKSSFLGVMVNKELDDGNGSARKKIAKHPHEVESGKTSSITTHTTEISKKKRVIFVDLCGHEKYLRTTITGLTGHFPDYGILVVAANRGVLRMTKEHLALFVCLKIPFVVLITRVDITPNDIYENTKKTVQKWLKKAKRKAILINTIEELKYNKSKLDKTQEKHMMMVSKYARNMKTNMFNVPVVTISNKSGYYVNVARQLIGNLEPRKQWEDINYSLFYIDSTFTPKGTGLVVAGTLKGKPIKTGTEMYLGPFNGEFAKIRVWSIHNNVRETIPELTDQKHGCLAIRNLNKKLNVDRHTIKKGMVIISDNKKTENFCYEFKAKVKVLHHSTIISNKFTSVIHCNTIKQTARIILNDEDKLKTGDTAIVGFRFIQRPEFLEPGYTFVFREGTTKGTGVVDSIVPITKIS